jgi:hypothetical protein
MSIENQNSDSTDELRRLVLGDELASESDIEALENLAYASVEGAPTSKILEVNYSVSPGYLSFMLLEESDTRDGTSPATVVSLHEGNTDDPFFSLCYDSNNNLCEPILSGKRSASENVFQGINILYEILSGDELGDISSDEEIAINNIMSFLNTVEGVKQDRVYTRGLTTPFTETIKKIVLEKCTAIQHVKEVNGNIGNGQEISIITADYEHIRGGHILSPDEQYPLLQVNLQDRKTSMLSYYLSLATGERVCDTSPIEDEYTEAIREFYISDDDDAVQVEADDIIANAMSAFDKRILESLSSAIVQLSINNEFKN